MIGICLGGVLRFTECGQPDLSKILRGHCHDVSVVRLLQFLSAFGQKVEIVVTTMPKGRPPRKVTVRAA